MTPGRESGTTRDRGRRKLWPVMPTLSLGKSHDSPGAVDLSSGWQADRLLYHRRYDICPGEETDWIATLRTTNRSDAFECRPEQVQHPIMRRR